MPGIGDTEVIKLIHGLEGERCLRITFQRCGFSEKYMHVESEE